MGHRSRTFPRQCQALWRVSHASTAAQENLTYLPRRTTGSGSLSRMRARSLVFSRIQLGRTARRWASCSAVSKTEDVDASAWSDVTPRITLRRCSIFCFVLIATLTLPCKSCAMPGSKPRRYNDLRASNGQANRRSFCFIADTPEFFPDVGGELDPLGAVAPLQAFQPVRAGVTRPPRLKRCLPAKWGRMSLPIDAANPLGGSRRDQVALPRSLDLISSRSQPHRQPVIRDRLPAVEEITGPKTLSHLGMALAATLHARPSRIAT